MSKVTRLIVAVVVMVGLLAGVLVPSTPAFAADLSNTVTMSSQHITVGATVAIGGGPGWAGGEAVTIYLASTNGERDWSNLSASGESVASAVADNVTSNWAASFIMPDRAGAQNQYMNGIEVYVQGSSNNAVFSVRGPATPANASNTVPTVGAATSARTKFPTGGAIWGAGGTGIARAILVDPFGVRSPSGGPPGTPITMKAGGFGANETGITLAFGDGGALNAGAPGPFVKTVASGITASSRGAWSATFNAPDAAPGKYNLVFNPGAIQQAANAGNPFAVPPVPLIQPITGAFANPNFFEITRGLKISPASGSLGTVVSFSAQGFTPNMQVSVTLNGQSLETIPSTILVGATGLVSGQAKIPADFFGITDGPAELILWDGPANVQTTATASSTFVISKKAATLTLNPQSGLGAILIQGKDFTAGSPVDIFFDGKKIAAFGNTLGGETVMATNPVQGISPTFTTIVAVPTTKAGKYEVKAVDVAGITATASFEVTAGGGGGGTAGPAGPAGKDGAPGKAGADGKAGAAGKAGADGKAGAAGKDGAPGKAGADGKAGATGPAGAAGAAGAAGTPANMLIVWIALILSVIAIIVAIIPMTQKKKA